jgi:hypothetical protein
MFLLQAPSWVFESPFLIVMLVVLIIWCIALVAVANGRFLHHTTKLCWFFIVLCLNVLGVLLFYIWGRKEIDNRPQNK